ELYAYGARSFSIYSADGELVFDSGSQFEELGARLSESTPLVFNSGHDDNEFDSRSDAKGIEPENLTIGEIDGRTYAFIGFERLGGVVVYDVTDPAASTYVEYVNNRSFDVSLGDAYEELEASGGSEEELAALVNSVGDLGPEGLDFIPADASPTGIPMIVVGNEVTGTTTLYTLDGAPVAAPSPEPTETAAPAPSEEPSPEPTETAAPAPGEEPAPAEEPSPAPTETAAPAPAEEPSEEPTPAPTETAAPAPAEDPSAAPSEQPAAAPGEDPLAPTGGDVTWAIGLGGAVLIAAGIVIARTRSRA
ncbi:choice-of-anchor I domain-containing protein, partial [Microbacterium gubbeenense]